MHSLHRKIFVTLGILLSFSSLMSTPVIVSAMNNNYSAPLTLNDKVYRTMRNVEGSLSGPAVEVQYLVYMKEGVNYAFSAEFDADCTGLFSIQLNRPGEAVGWANDYEVWTSTDVNKTLTMRVTPDTTGEHILIVLNGATGSSATYFLNFGRTEIWPYWWIFLVVGGVLILIIVVIVVSVRKKKGKPKSKKKK